MERERISRDLHDSIGAYANAVLYNTELLEKENALTQRTALMSDLKFASKDIITALRETIWALKKDNYTAEDCLLRIKNFVQPLSRYYTHIQFTVSGEAPAMDLHYTKALNLVRIVQEAVTNSLKHATPAHIGITSIEWEGKWELVVSDDGKGFDHESVQEKEQGNGLANMKQRALDSGLGFTFSSETGNGTRVCIIV
jgi:signal transduction histidine kinase